MNGAPPQKKPYTWLPLTRFPQDRVTWIQKKWGEAWFTGFNIAFNVLWLYYLEMQFGPIISIIPLLFLLSSSA